MNKIRKFFKRFVLRDWWVVRRGEFPFPKGYCTYNSWINTVADTGLQKEKAQSICDVMNREK